MVLGPDWYQAGYYGTHPDRDPAGPPTVRNRVARGGSWCDPDVFLQCAYRSAFAPGERQPYIGFRCVRSVR